MRIAKLLLAGLGASLALGSIPAAALAQQAFDPTIQVSRGNARGGGTDSVSGFDFSSGVPTTQQSITVTRGTAVIANATGTAGSDGVSASVSLQSGDVIKYSENGNVVETVTFDGTPSFDTVPCNTTSVSGSQIAGAQLRGGVSGQAMPYQPSQRFTFTSTGSRFTGTVPRAIQAGAIVTINEDVTQTPAQGGGRYSSSLSVVACGAAATTNGQGTTTTTTTNTSIGTTNTTTTTSNPVITPILPLLGKVTFLSGRHLLSTFFSSGLTELVTLTGPGTVFADIYQANGKVPAQASKKKKSKKKGATLLGRAQVTALHAGTVKVTIKPNRAARKLKKKKKLRVSVVTSLRNSVGVYTHLPTQHLTLKK